MYRWRGLISPLLCLGLLRAAPSIAANEIFESLVSDGVAVGPQESIKLPQPILADGLDAAGQRRAIESLMAERYSWEEFTRQSVVSPFVLKIEDSARAAGQIGRRVDIGFVAYGTLDKLSSQDYLTEQLNLAAAKNRGDEEGGVHVLSSDDLSARGLPLPRRPEDPRWVFVQSTLLGKVRISLTTRNVKTQTGDSVVIASVVDPKFNQDTAFPNRWRPITIDDAGRRQVGPAQPYAGLGSYVKLTRLAEPAGAIFVENHIAFAEPEGWFHGANLLRSKLPLVAQDMVRTFRRNIDKR